MKFRLLQKYHIVLILIISCFLLVLSGCSNNTDTEETTDTTTNENNAEEDFDSSWDISTSTMISFDGDSINIDGDGATTQDTTLTINSEGTYVLNGTLDDGQVIINASKDALVRLVLNDVTISNSDGATIHSMQARKVIVILADESENSLSDGENYTTLEEEPNAALFSKDDLTINGTGTLQVTGNYENGISTKDNLIIVSGTINVTSVNNAIRGTDSVTIYDGTLNLTAGNDGIQSSKNDDTTKGWIKVIDGIFIINASNDAIQAETTIDISGGDYTIISGLGSTSIPTATTDSDSYKGIKAAGNITISGGTFVIDSSDDTIHSDENITISGGDLTLSSGDDGVHANSDLLISDTKINIKTSYEGLEGSTVTIKNGDIYILATDDGINAAGGSDSNGEGGFSPDTFNQSVKGEYYINIEGGTIEVNASGDGIDSNSDINMSGGTLYVSGPTNDGDAALDYDGTFTMSGGTIIAVGTSGMAETPSTTSSQASLIVYFTSSQSAGSTIEIRDASGKTLASYTPEKNFQSAVFSTSGMAVGSTYTIYVNDTAYSEVTLSSMISSHGNGGMGNPGQR